MSNSSQGTCAALGFLISVFALGAALYLQINKDWFPCPLCILQRYAYMATALGFALCWVSSGRGGLFSVSRASAFAGALSGAGLAAYHVWVLANPQQTCGVDPLQLKLNAMPWVQWWPAMFESDGLCSDVYPPLFGLSLPAWSGIGFFVLLTLFMGLRTRRRRW